MYPIPPNETLLETKVCHHCNTSFPITDKDMEFYEKVSPIFGGKKYQIPTPTLCPDCRQQRRLSFRNERKLYKRKCDATEKNIISIYSPDKPFKVYHQDYWWNDAWDPIDYGREFDFGRGFFEQFGELLQEVPKPSIHTLPNENSDYTNQSGQCKDCYLIFGAWGDENCHYSSSIHYSQNSLDSTVIERCSECYECIECQDSFHLFFSIRSKNCKDSYYLKDCIGCTQCFGCSNLHNKQYYIYNKFVGKEQYLMQITSLLKGKTEIKGISKNLNITQGENCIGDTIHRSRDVFSSFEVTDSERVRYCQSIYDVKDSMDVTVYGENCSRLYEGMSLGPTTNNALFSSNSYENVSNLIYCIQCVNGTNNCLFCYGLRNKSYCILNRQYTKEEYEILAPRIIEHMRKTGEWGEFFPSSLSPFGYNETVAQEYFPLTKEEATKDGIFNWSDYEAPFPKVEKIIPANKLPEDISKIPDDILNWAIECEVTKKPFRIIKQELEFYRKHNLPIPRRHPDQRHLDRMALRNPRKLFERKCDKCGKDMITTYSPDRKEIVYCEECYNKEVIG